PRTFGVPGTGLRRPRRRPDGSGPGLGRGPAAKRDRGLPSRGRADAPLQHRVKAILALAQGTTGSSAIVSVTQGSARGTADREIRQFYPSSGHFAQAREGLFATLESWLVWKLTAGRVHATDLSNASRTLVFDIHRRTWDDELLGILGIPRAMLPSAVRSSGVVAETDAAHFGSPVSIAGI